MEHSIDLWRLLNDLKIQLTPLSQDYVFKSFDCGVCDLNDFLLNDAKIYLKYLDIQHSF